MNEPKRKRKKKRMWIIFLIIAIIIVGVIIFIHQPKFGSTPKGERKERIEHSPNYRDGKFQNLSHTPQIILDEGLFTALTDFFFTKTERKPEKPIPADKIDLYSLDIKEDILVWFGHSSCFVQLKGKRILIDPVFSQAASPLFFINKPFKGTDIYSATDIPDIDYLIITHDHWDHLDYPTIKTLKSRIKQVICPLGAGAHFERWRFNKENIIEMDWEEKAVLSPEFELYCLPARHFSGRGFNLKQSLWASFLLKTSDFTLYIGGDGGYDTHFADIGNRFGEIDLALLENGQYNEKWRYIHMLPEQTLKAGKDLRAKTVFPVHNSKFALGQHAWDEPLRTLTQLHHDNDFRLITPKIGQIVYLKDTLQLFEHWWEEEK
ncbi:MAG: MBL fold metallo-hydrolase [Bacteroidales bacterium]|jgi:L-ascorbate metabolism protein UlaG (beta-lactamase superfamily)|nr:MBL fold metallo-hydrolase [Bacteroidales bacterium]